MLKIVPKRPNIKNVINSKFEIGCDTKLNKYSVP